MPLGLDPLSKKKVRTVFSLENAVNVLFWYRTGISWKSLELLILDEPFNGQDRQGAWRVCELLRGLKEREEGLILSQHITCWRSNGTLRIYDL